MHVGLHFLEDFFFGTWKFENNIDPNLVFADRKLSYRIVGYCWLFVIMIAAWNVQHGYILRWRFQHLYKADFCL